MSSVLQHYGAELGEDLTARLKAVAPQFVADLSGKMLESAILNKGDLSNFDGILKNYVLSYASGGINTRLAEVFGSESSAHYAQIFNGLGSALIDGGEQGLTDYLGSSAFLNALGEGVSIDVAEYFGGIDSFKGEVLSQLARAAIISGGDPERLANSAITIGQGLLAQYSADVLRQGLSQAPAEVAGRAETLTELCQNHLNVLIEVKPVEFHRAVTSLSSNHRHQFQDSRIGIAALRDPLPRRERVTALARHGHRHNQ